MQPLPTPQTAAEARQQAIDWQSDVAEWSHSCLDIAEAQAHFAALAERWPELKEEFIENGII